jgi:hypothetical protein
MASKLSGANGLLAGVAVSYLLLQQQRRDGMLEEVGVHGASLTAI